VLTISESYLYPFALVISLRDYKSGRVIDSQLVLLVYLITFCVGCLLGFSTAGSKFVLIVRQARMVST
jgi:hypothetical protein